MKKALLFFLVFIIILSCAACSGADDLSAEKMIGTWKMEASAIEFISMNEDNILKENFEEYINQVDFSGLTLTFNAEFYDDGTYLIFADEDVAEKEISAIYDAVFEAYDRDKEMAMRFIGGSLSEPVTEQEFDDILSQHGYTYEEYVSEIKRTMSEDIDDFYARYINEIKYGGSYFVEITEKAQGEIYFDKEKTRFAKIKYAKSEATETIDIISSNMVFFSQTKQLGRV